MGEADARGTPSDHIQGLLEMPGPSAESEPVSGGTGYVSIKDFVFNWVF